MRHSLKNLFIPCKSAFIALPPSIQVAGPLTLLFFAIFAPACTKKAPNFELLINNYNQHIIDLQMHAIDNIVDKYGSTPPKPTPHLLSYLDYPIPYKYVEYHQLNHHIVPENQIDRSPDVYNGHIIPQHSILRDDNGNISSDLSKPDGTFTPGSQLPSDAIQQTSQISDVNDETVEVQTLHLELPKH